MSKSELESATLFTPGRSSYLDEEGILQLSEGSHHRAAIATATFDENFHDSAVFSGGFPGLSQGWDESLTPPTDRREAHLMAIPLTERLKREGKTAEEIKSLVKIQGDSDSSFSDVIVAIDKGILDPNSFNTDNTHGINLVTGAFHGKRFSLILSKALDISPSRIQRVGMTDIYGTPEHPQRASESATKAFITELGAITITQHVLKNVKNGDLGGIKDAEQQFISIYKRLSRLAK